MPEPRPKLPDAITACLFDMDGVLTRTATVHAKAWAEAFDTLLRQRALHGPAFVPFDPKADYTAHVDGKPREDGVRDFLASRGITLPEGSREDPPTAETVHGVGNAKNVKLLEVLKRDGVTSAGILELFEERVDGTTIAAEGIRGKPAPDTFVLAAKRLGLYPADCAVFEDALAGVEAGRAGSFGWVVGVDRAGHADALREHGADVVVGDLAELLP